MVKTFHILRTIGSLVGWPDPAELLSLEENHLINTFLPLGLITDPPPSVAQGPKWSVSMASCNVKVGSF